MPLCKLVELFPLFKFYVPVETIFLALDLLALPQLFITVYPLDIIRLGIGD